VGLELHWRIGHSGRGSLSCFRTRDGMEIDDILEYDKRPIPSK